MSVSSLTRLPRSYSGEVNPEWSCSFAPPLQSVHWAREREQVLVRDSSHVLHLLNRQGKLQARHQAPGPLSASAISEDGTAILAASTGGDLWWLTPDLSARWHRRLGHRITSLAVDSLGQYVSVSDSSGAVTTFTRSGDTAWATTLLLALSHLVHIPESPHLLGCADLGLITCLSFVGGEQVWYDRRVTHVGGLAVNGKGNRMVLACFNDGLSSYQISGPPAETWHVGQTCRRVALSYDGEVMLIGGLQERVLLVNGQAEIIRELLLGGTPTHVQLGALAQDAIIGFQDGRVEYINWR